MRNLIICFFTFSFSLVSGVVAEKLPPMVVDICDRGNNMPGADVKLNLHLVNDEDDFKSRLLRIAELFSVDDVPVEIYACDEVSIREVCANVDILKSVGFKNVTVFRSFREDGILFRLKVEFGDAEQDMREKHSRVGEGVGPP